MGMRTVKEVARRNRICAEFVQMVIHAQHVLLRGERSGRDRQHLPGWQDIVRLRGIPFPFLTPRLDGGLQPAHRREFPLAGALGALPAGLLLPGITGLGGLLFHARRLSPDPRGHKLGTAIDRPKWGNPRHRPHLSPRRPRPDALARTPPHPLRAVRGPSWADHGASPSFPGMTILPISNRPSRIPPRRPWVSRKR